jgi:uncharacterized membrane protein YoaK (UPF0700 family)
VQPFTPSIDAGSQHTLSQLQLRWNAASYLTRSNTVLRRIGLSFLAAIAGYLAGAFGGGWLVSSFSGSADRSVEAAMTGAFVFGPATACAAFIITLVVTGRSRPV